ncbi:hypothetical protein VaNZ11_006325 [Volvox africanus]|uniref:Uncharacterized protein n=1 Tax=Volvox africanus TaxID=51714 RepID=A0ABQ5S133_9CHLO|nr:hypothetical protein VaNZ11_006325 [Volvox africanus]
MSCVAQGAGLATAGVSPLAAPVWAQLLVQYSVLLGHIGLGLLLWTYSQVDLMARSTNMRCRKCSSSAAKMVPQKPWQQPARLSPWRAGAAESVPSWLIMMRL